MTKSGWGSKVTTDNEVKSNSNLTSAQLGSVEPNKNIFFCEIEVYDMSDGQSLLDVIILESSNVNALNPRRNNVLKCER
jgi:hypothetical protein